MPTIDGKSLSLNKEVYDALKKIKPSDGISKEEAVEIQKAIDADGTVDADEAKLLKEMLANKTKFDVTCKDAGFAPLQLDFGGLSTEAKDLFEKELFKFPEFKQLTSEALLNEAKTAKTPEDFKKVLKEKYRLNEDVANDLASHLYDAVKSPNLEKKLDAIETLLKHQKDIPDGAKLIETLQEDIGKELKHKGFEEQFNLVKRATTFLHAPAQEICKKFKLFDAASTKIVDVMKFMDWMKLKGLDYSQLGDNLEAQIKLRNLATNTNDIMKKEISKLLGGVELTGDAKQVTRVLDKMMKGDSHVGDLKDMARARINFSSLDPEEIKGFVEILKKEYNLKPNEVKDYLKYLDNPASDYKGRVHLNLTSKSGMKFELQIGPGQLSTFYDTEFKVMGVKQNLHDLFYKGIDQYLLKPGDEDYEKALRAFGNGDAAKGKEIIEKTLKELGGGDIEKGKEVLMTLKKTYRANLEEVISMAKKGVKFGDFDEFKLPLFENPDFMKMNKQLIEDLDKVLTKIPKENLPPMLQEALAKTGATLAKQSDEVVGLIKGLKVDDASKGVLTKLSKSGVVDETAMKNIIKAVNESAGDSKTLQAIIKTLKDADPATIGKAFAKDDTGKSLITLAKKLIPVFEKYGMESSQIIAKISKGLSKVLPVVGGLASGFDTVRLGAIAISGKDPFFGKNFTSTDPKINDVYKDVRALALLGAELNAADTVLAVIEATGIGNIDLPVQLALAGGEIAIDIMVDYFQEHPEKMPKELRLAIKAAALGTVLSAPVTMGMTAPAAAAVLNIYGLDGTIDIATEFTKLMGNATLKGIDKLNQLQAKVMEKGLDLTIDSLNTAADIIRNPEVYAAKLGKSVDEVLTMAKDWMVKQAKKGIEEAKEVFKVLKDIAVNPGKYGEKALSFAIDTAKTVGTKVAHATDMAIDFIVEQVKKGGALVQEGLTALWDMGDKAVDKSKEAIKYLYNKSAETAKEVGAFLIDVAQSGIEEAKEVFKVLKDIAVNPGKYGEKALSFAIDTAKTVGTKVAHATDMAIDFIVEQVKKGGALVQEGLTALWDMGDKAVDKSKEAIKYLYNKSAETAKEVGAFLIDVAQNPGKYGQKAVEYGKQAVDAMVDAVKAGGRYAGQALQNLKDLAASGAEAAYDGLKDLAASSAKHAKEIIKFAATLSDKAREKIAEGIKTLISTGKDAIDFMSYVARHPKEVVTALGETGKEILVDTYEGLVSLAKGAKNVAGKAVDALCDFYDNTKEYIADLKDRTGKALGRFGDTIVDLAKGGVDVTEKAIKRFYAVAKDKIPALMSAIKNFATAPVDLMVKIAKWEIKMAGQVIDTLKEMGAAGIKGLKNLGDAGVEALKEMVLKGGIIAKEAWNELKAMGDKAIDAIKEIGLASKEYALEAINTLKAMGNQAIDAIKDIGNKFHEYADEAIDALKGMGKKAVDGIKAIGEKYADLMGDAIDALQSMGETAKDAIVDLAKRGVAKAQDALVVMSKTYSWAKQEVADLINNGKMALSKIKDAGASVISYVQSHANIETLKNMAKEGIGNLKQIVNTLWNKGTEGFRALMEVYKDVKSAAKEILNYVVDKLETAWDNSSWSNGYQGIRDLISEIYDTAKAAGGEAFTTGRQMLYDAVKYVDNNVAGGYVPDFLYNWVEP